MDGQEWRDHISRYGSLRTYKNFKNELVLENYLDLKLPSSVIGFYTKLRGGLSHSEVTTGRWANPPVEYAQRLCRLCNLNRIEDEAHILFDCPIWTTYRQQLHSYHCFAQKNLEGVCSSTDADFIGDLVKYLQLVLAKKAEILAIL